MSTQYQFLSSSSFLNHFGHDFSLTSSWKPLLSRSTISWIWLNEKINFHFTFYLNSHQHWSQSITLTPPWNIFFLWLQKPYLVLVWLLPRWLHLHSLLCFYIPEWQALQCLRPMLYSLFSTYTYSLGEPVQSLALNNTYKLITPKMSLLPGPFLNFRLIYLTT